MTQKDRAKIQTWKEATRRNKRRKIQQDNEWKEIASARLRRWKIRSGLTVAVYFGLLAVWYAGKLLLEAHGMEYRDWVDSLAFFWRFLLPVPLGTVLLVSLYRRLRERYPGKVYDVACLMTLVVFLCVSLFLAGRQTLQRFLNAGYEELLPTGYLKIHVDDYPDRWYYCAPYSSFARIPLTETTTEEDSRYETVQTESANPKETLEP